MSEFPHLYLLRKQQGSARLEGGGSKNPAVEKNEKNRQAHSDALIEKFNAFSSYAENLQHERKKKGLPEIKGGTSFMLQIPDEDDGAIEFIAEKLGLEVVAEYEDGYLIVATQDIELTKVVELASAFASKEHGSGAMAKILSIEEDPHSEARVARIIADGELLRKWPFPDRDEFVLDVSIESSAFGFPSKPRINSRSNTSIKEQKIQEYQKALEDYRKHWDAVRIEREIEIERFVTHYGGEICSITDSSHLVEFPDSFSVRIKMSGRGFKDIILNYPNLFEITLPDDVCLQPVPSAETEEYEDDFALLPPDPTSPAICVVDSGMQEGHKWLDGAVELLASKCFIPGKMDADVADYVKGGGHGTRVAGAILYPNAIPKENAFQAPFWILNARVLDEHCRLSNKIFPPELLREIVEFYKTSFNSRIFNHSIASGVPCRSSRMSAWATAIDFLSYNEDVLFIQATGNLHDSGKAFNPGILDHIKQGRVYPEYLHAPSSRIANPAQSLQALTVGSIAAEFYKEQDKRSIANSHYPSAFTRTGFGLWDSIKPEVVEFGGDLVADTGNPPALTTPPEVCPELIRSTINGGPPYANDCIGTSFSAPKVTHIAGKLETLFPDRETLLYKGLIVNSARWPEWAERCNELRRPNVVRAIGYGIPDLERATTNSINRTTLISDSLYEIKAQEGFVFGVPIPAELRRPGEEISYRVDVTLSYAAEPRRTRKSRRGYLGVWLDWKASKRSESFDAFSARALKETDEIESDDDGNFPWILGNKKEKDGITDGVLRKNGTVQKDWMIAKSYELPDIFGIVVRGHKGWARLNPEATARFSLVISIEALSSQVQVYERIRKAIQVETEIQLKT